MSSFVPRFLPCAPGQPLRSSFSDIDSPEWNGRGVDEDAAPDTVRSPGQALAVSFDAADDEPLTIRNDEEIRAAAPRLARNVDPSRYVFEESFLMEIDVDLEAPVSAAPPSMTERIRELVHELGSAVERFIAA